MISLPELDRLSIAEKDELIRVLHAQVAVLTKQVGTLTAKVTLLEGRLALNSRNSSVPPSKAGYDKQNRGKTASAAGKKKSGGQKGHAGNTLKKSEAPDHIVVCPTPEHCDVCQALLPAGEVVEARQVSMLSRNVRFSAK
jgi:hypothetical protein